MQPKRVSTSGPSDLFDQPQNPDPKSGSGYPVYQSAGFVYTELIQVADAQRDSVKSNQVGPAAEGAPPLPNFYGNLPERVTQPQGLQFRTVEDGQPNLQSSLSPAREDASSEDSLEASVPQAKRIPSLYQQKKEEVEQGARGFLFLFFGIGPGWPGEPASNLIHPKSVFSAVMTVISVICLLYVFVTVQIEIGFFWTYEGCREPNTQLIDIGVDIFFIVEVLTSLVTGVYIEGEYHGDSIVQVAKYQLTTYGFYFDAVTSTPVALISALLFHCDGDNDINGGPAVKLVRAVKPARLFMILKLIKLGKFEVFIPAINKLEKRLGIPAVVIHMMNVFFLLTMLVHSCACLFWLIKYVSETDDEIEDFLNGFNIGGDPDPGFNNDPDNVFAKYMLAGYYINTVFTTVGFGDVTAQSTVERIFGVFIMYLGAVVFGVVIGEVQDAIGRLRQESRDEATMVYEAKSFLRKHDCPSDLEKDVLDWLHFSSAVEREHEQAEAFFSKLDDGLKHRLQTFIHKRTLNKIELLAMIHHSSQDDFLVKCFARMTPVPFNANSEVVKLGDSSDSMYLLTYGQIRAIASNGSVVTTLHAGEAICAESLFIPDSSPTIGPDLPVTFRCINKVKCLKLCRSDFVDILENQFSHLIPFIGFIKQRILEKQNAKMHKNLKVQSTKNVIAMSRWCCMILRTERLRRQRGQSNFFNRDAIDSGQDFFSAKAELVGYERRQALAASRTNRQ